MKFFAVAAMAAALSLVASVTFAEPLVLEPASPQPSSVKPGLSVKYAWLGKPPQKIQSIGSAKNLLRAQAEPGDPLRGLDYRDTKKGDPVMTHPEHYNVAADIEGYIKFDAPGLYELVTYSNDGIEAWVGGQKVGSAGASQPCSANEQVEVEVPQAGWYKLQIFYYQKYGSACLMMKWGKSGEKLKWTPNEAFGR